MSGHYIELADGDPYMFGTNDSAPGIEVIAHALSQLCRFTGHSAYATRHNCTSQIYSVAQHCVKVSKLVPEKYALVGLMHDAHEALIGDVSTPLKRYLAEQGVSYNLVDREAWLSIARTYDLPHTMPDAVKHADALMCLIEAIDLMPSRAKHWGPPFDDLREEALELYIDRPELRSEAWPVNVSKDKFLERYVELTEAK